MSNKNQQHLPTPEPKKLSDKDIKNIKDKAVVKEKQLADSKEIKK